MGLFLGGIPPAVAPEGDLVYGDKVESPLISFIGKFTSVQPTGASDMCKKDLEILSRGRSDIAVGCSKRW
jgi:hypothetical protein